MSIVGCSGAAGTAGALCIAGTWSRWIRISARSWSIVVAQLQVARRGAQLVPWGWTFVVGLSLGRGDQGKCSPEAVKFGLYRALPIYGRSCSADAPRAGHGSSQRERPELRARSPLPALAPTQRLCSQTPQRGGPRRHFSGTPTRHPHRTRKAVRRKGTKVEGRARAGRRRGRTRRESGCSLRRCRDQFIQGRTGALNFLAEMKRGRSHVDGSGSGAWRRWPSWLQRGGAGRCRERLRTSCRERRHWCSRRLFLLLQRLSETAALKSRRAIYFLKGPLTRSP